MYSCLSDKGPDAPALGSGEWGSWGAALAFSGAGGVLAAPQRLPTRRALL